MAKWWSPPACVLFFLSAAALSPAAPGQDGAASQGEEVTVDALAEVLEEVQTLWGEAKEGTSPDQVADRRERTARLVEALIELWGEKPADRRRREPLYFLGQYASDLADDSTSARALEWLLDDLLHQLPDEHPKIQELRARCALSQEWAGNYERAIELREAVIAAREATLEPADPLLLRARYDRLVLLWRDHHPDVVRAEYSAFVASLEELVPPGDPLLIEARGSFAAHLGRTGHLPEAVEIEEEIIAALEDQDPVDEALLDNTLVNYSSHLGSLGELDRAGEIEEQLLAKYTPKLPEEHEAIVQLRTNHAGTLMDLGHLAEAAVVFDRLLVVLQRLHPPSHPLIQQARVNSATAHAQLGDEVKARMLVEAALAVLQEEKPPNEVLLLQAMRTRAEILAVQDEWDAAMRQLEEWHARVEAAHIPERDPYRLGGEISLATCRREAGQLEEALELGERVLADVEEHLGERHPLRRKAEGELAVTLLRCGRFERASALEARALAGIPRSGDAERPVRLQLLARHAWTLDLLEDEAGSRELLGELSEGLRRWTDSALLLPPREASAAAVEVTKCLSPVLSLQRPGEDRKELMRTAFELILNARVLHGLGSGLGGNDTGKVVGDLRQEVRRCRARISDLAASRGNETDEDESGLGELDAAVSELDRAEGALRARLVSAGALPSRLDAARLGRALPEDAVAVSYFSYLRWIRAGKDGREREREEHLLAHVLRPDGEVIAVELGREQEILDLTRRWREAIGAPLSGERPLEPGPAEAASAAGRELRERVLGPVLRAAGEARALHVCLDGPLHLLPLEALPVGDGGRGVLGDERELYFHDSLAELLEEHPSRKGEPTFLAIGGVDFDARPAAGVWRESDDQAEAVAASLRASGPESPFSPLTGTAPEILSLGELFESRLGREGILLGGSTATKASLQEHAPGSRYLHVATHGYFAREAWGSAMLRMFGGLDLEYDTETALRAMAPMSLCGLALAGANRGADELGHVPGIITAEEIAGLDLSRCELAVLSACETGAGESLPGLGIASLQTALHAAGARCAVTALWKVDDALTRELMVGFYERVWSEDPVPPARALWEAKCAFRRAGANLRDWAGWVLTGAGD